MPTPFYHLSVAEDLLGGPGLSSKARDFLKQNRPAFLLGNTAPDVQTVSGQSRQETHFFDLPIRPGDQPAWEQILAAHPSLAHPAGLLPDQAAFLAGYLCHLQADWFWVQEIFLPVFGPGQAWDSQRRRLYLHNVLRAYLDRQILMKLRDDMGSVLPRALPRGWLPFVKDIYLSQWRDYLAHQLHPGSAVQTVEVFAARQGIAPDEFYRLLNSEERLEKEIFIRLPRQDLHTYRQRLLAENALLIQAYLEGRAKF